MVHQKIWGWGAALIFSFAFGTQPDPTQGDPKNVISQIFTTIFPDSILDTLVDTTTGWAPIISSLLSVPISQLALAIFVAALLYRIYNLWLSEASSTALFYSIIRFGFIGAFLLLSNNYLAARNAGEPIKSSAVTCASFNSMVLSQTAYCTWRNGFDAGRKAIQGRGYEQRIVNSTKNFIAAFSSSMVALSYFNVLKTTQATMKALSRAKKIGPTGSPPPQAPPAGGGGNAPPTPKEKLLDHLTNLSGLLPFVVYILLAIPSLIYNFIVLVSGLITIIAIIFLPLAIALIAWGFVQPTIQLGFTILAQSIAVFLLPTIFMLGFGFALEQPANMLKGMTAHMENRISVMTEDLADVFRDEEDKIANVPADNPVEWLKRTFVGIEDWFTDILKATLSVLVNLGIVIILTILSGAFFLVSLAISYSAALSLLNTVPNIILGMWGGGMNGPNLYGPPQQWVTKPGRLMR